MTVYTGAPTTLVAGDTSALVTKFNDHRDALKALSEARSTWVPTYTGITSIGDATVTARYLQVGKFVTGHYLLAVGSTTTFGAASLTVSLPVTALTNGAVLGVGMVLDASPVVRQIITAYAASTTTAGFITTSSSTPVSNTVPWTWTTDDVLRFEFAYEAA